ncbi:MAG: glycan-binding surface protein [Bacteroidota bacterium]|nr:glycan-binding surface protein [Bacteroidota bacterium]
MSKQILFLLVIAAGLVQYGCKKENAGGSGTPVIDRIRVVDSTKRDSFFTAAQPGTLIVIQGSNFGGLQAVYFNDTAAAFNPSYTTSTNIIVAIPRSAQTKATIANVPDVIRVVTDHGSVTYAFQLYLPPPVITSIAFDNSGTMVTITGSNFQGIKKITFPVPSPDTALSYSVNKEFTQIVAAIPPGNPAKDSIRVYCTFGTASFLYPPPMTITSVSNENGASGTTITLNGTNFVGVKQVTFPGGIVGTNLKPISVNQLTVNVPNGVTTADYLKLTGVLGSTTSPLPYATYITHPSPGYISNFDDQYNSDNTGFVGWTGGYADASTAAQKYQGATGGVAVLQQGAPMAANAGPTSQGNPGLLQLNEEPWVANTNQSIAGYALKFEMFVVTPWTAGQLWISVGGWYGWTSYTARYAPWETSAGGKYQPTGWQTVTIPLTEFRKGNEFYKTSYNATGAAASKFSDYPSTALGFLIANDQAKAVPANSVNLAIDNVRIVKVP